MGCYPSDSVGTNFLGPGQLGSHSYGFNPLEKNGIVFTCKGGHVDIAHLRIAADWTRYLSQRAKKAILKSDARFSYKFSAEPSRYYIDIAYPSYWDKISKQKREKIASDISLNIGQYLAYTSTTWHEIITWYGYKCILFFPEFPSAFSWEDCYSNLLGTYLATNVLKENPSNYNKSLTKSIDQELELLGIQTSQVAKKAARDVHGKWYDGAVLFMVSMKKRHFDIGLENGYVTPLIIPYVTDCKNTTPRAYPIPTLKMLEHYGFNVRVRIKLQEWERQKILAAAYPKNSRGKKYIEPEKHFPQILKIIRKEATEYYGINQTPEKLQTSLNDSALR
jgi:hypothetical protein